jgi:hypothetical protein
MLFSCSWPFIVTPWAAVRILKSGGAHHAAASWEDFVTRLYRRVMGSCCTGRVVRWSLLSGASVILLLASCASSTPDL